MPHDPGRREVVNRLTAQDLMMVWPEEMGWSQDIGVLMILEGRGPFDADGSFPIEAAREHVERRLHLVPPFRRLLRRPGFGLGWPLWVDAPEVDLDRHVRVFPLEPPADEDQLLSAVEELRRRRWHESRPPWEMWFLPGLADRRVGLYVKLHHAVADGMAGIAALGAFLDPFPDPPEMRPPPWEPAPAPTTRELFEDNVRARLRGLGRLFDKLAFPGETVRAIRRGWPAVKEAFFEERAPRTSLNGRVGWQRRLAVVRSDLDVAKRIAHTHGAKVNDVVLAVVAGGLRGLLRSRGERVDELTLRAFVPVSLHREKEAVGNLDGGMVVPLPIGESRDAERLRAIAAETTARKERARPPGGTLFRNIPIQRAALRLAPRQRAMNTYVANLPGPPIPMYFAGARVLEAFPVVPILGNVTIGVGALSYAGQFNLTVVADRDRSSDLERFLEGTTRSLEILERSASAEPETAVERRPEFSPGWAP